MAYQKTTSGRVHKYGDNIDTDVIIPARYLNAFKPEELAAHCMEDIDAEFTSRVQAGDIIVAGNNFGSGSSREHAPLAIKASGISCVIAASFARIFYRNAINIGLPILESPSAASALQNGERVEVDFSDGTIRSLNSGQIWLCVPFPKFIQEIISAGGLVEYTRRTLESQHAIEKGETL